MSAARPPSRCIRRLSYACRRSADNATPSVWLRPGCSRRPVRRFCPASAGALGVQARHDARTPLRFSRISIAWCTGLACSSASARVLCHSQSILARTVCAMHQGPSGPGRLRDDFGTARGGSGSTRWLSWSGPPLWALSMAARQVRMPLGRIKSPGVTVMADGPRTVMRLEATACDTVHLVSLVAIARPVSRLVMTK
jgi:hypothetical protein